MQVDGAVQRNDIDDQGFGLSFNGGFFFAGGFLFFVVVGFQFLLVMNVFRQQFEEHIQVAVHEQNALFLFVFVVFEQILNAKHEQFVYQFQFHFFLVLEN